MTADLSRVLADLWSLRFLRPDAPAPGQGDPGRARLAMLRDEVQAQLLADRPAPVLPWLRTEAYRLAACTWEDPWAYGLVAWCEEATAEGIRLTLRDAPPQDPAWRHAWSAWRTAWWIRRAQGADDHVLAHGDLVMGMLHARMARWSDAAARLDEALAREASPARPRVRHLRVLLPTEDTDPR